MNEREVKSEDDAGKPDAMYYCEKCNRAWWYDEMGQVNASKPPSEYKDNVVKNAEHKLCKDC